MLDEPAPPIVNRFNPWGQWRPFAFSTMEEHLAFTKECKEASADPDVQATVAYTRATKHEGIEFVLLSEYWDNTRTRTYGGGITVVRVTDPPTEPHEPRPLVCIYDGWLPLEETTIASIRTGLRKLQDVVDFLAYQYGVPVRTFIKYREAFDQISWRNTTDDDDARFRDRLTRTLDLPDALRTAVLRCTHWHQNAKRQVRTTDRFLSLWLAIESLALVLYENSGVIHLPLDGESVPLTKKQRRAAQEARIEQILLQDFPSASERVSAAYFEGVKALRRRVEAALKAVLGDDARIGWLYSRGGPNEMRGKLVHEGWSELDVAHACDLGDYCHRIGLLIKELIERVLFRNWGNPIELPRKTFTMRLDPTNTIPIGTGIRFEGDFAISYPLLAHKGVLRF
jgi:hypothetical protein